MVLIMNKSLRLDTDDMMEIQLRSLYIGVFFVMNEVSCT